MLLICLIKTTRNFCLKCLFFFIFCFNFIRNQPLFIFNHYDYCLAWNELILDCFVKPLFWDQEPMTLLFFLICLIWQLISFIIRYFYYQRFYFGENTKRNFFQKAHLSSIALFNLHDKNDLKRQQHHNSDNLYFDFLSVNYFFKCPNTSF